MKKPTLKSAFPFIASAFMMAACGNNRTSPETTTPMDTIPTSEFERQEYFERVRDSLMHATQAYEIWDYATHLEYVRWPLSEKLDSLRYDCTMADKMAAEISDAQYKYLTDTIRSINDTYLSLKNVCLKHEYFDPRNRDLTDISLQSNDMNTAHPYVYEFQPLFLTGMSQYTTEQQAEIKSKIHEMLIQADSVAYKIAESIAKKYAKYYPIADIEKNVPDEYRQYFDPRAIFTTRDEGRYVFSPSSLKNSRNIGVFRTIHLYDSELSPNFFRDSTCTYKLNSISKNRWQITKIHPDGMMEFSAIFTDDKEWFTAPYLDTNTMPENDIRFRPGKNMGVHIDATEVLFSANPEIANDALPDPHGTRSKQIQQLTDSVRNLGKKSKDLHKKFYNLERHADSLAVQMTQKKFDKTR